MAAGRLWVHRSISKVFTHVGDGAAAEDDRQTDKRECPATSSQHSQPSRGKSGFLEAKRATKATMDFKFDIVKLKLLLTDALQSAECQKYYFLLYWSLRLSKYPDFSHGQTTYMHEYESCDANAYKSALDAPKCNKREFFAGAGGDQILLRLKPPCLHLQCICYTI